MPARRGDERTGSSFLAAIVGGSVSGGDGNLAAADTHLQDEAPEVVGPPMQRRRLHKKSTDVAGIFGDQYASSMPARRRACKCFKRLYKCPKMPFKCP